VSKETYYSVKTYNKERKVLKRDLLQSQKRPTTVSKETYYSVKTYNKERKVPQILILIVEKLPR